MKTLALLALLALCIALPSCAFRAYYPNGHVACADYTDFEGTTEIKTRDFYLKRTGRQDASTPTRTAFREAGNAAFKLGLGTAGAVAPVP